MAAKMRLRFERSGRVLDVAEFRRDGWPICPSCNDDELAALAESTALGATDWERAKANGTLLDRLTKNLDFCYHCGPVEVVSHDDGEPADPLPGVD